MSSEEGESLSALRENIKSKGNNSYYYAHGKKVDGPQWDGNEQPRLLETTVISTPVRRIQSLTSYAWTDEKNSVKIYIDFEEAETIDDSSISLETIGDTMKFLISTANHDHVLMIDSLHDKVESATYKKKSKKFVLSLKKEVPCTWYNLKKSSSK